MLKLRHSIVLAFMCCSLSWTVSMAQNLNIKDVEKIESPVPAKDFPKDLNGNQCALVIVDSDNPGIVFEGNIIGTPAFKDGSYFVYLTQGSKFLNIKYPGLSPMLMRFSEYGIDELPALSALNIEIGNASPVAEVAQQSLSPEAEENFETAYNLFQQQDWVHSYDYFLKADRAGHPKAGYYIGYIFSDPFYSVRKQSFMIPKGLKSAIPESPVSRDQVEAFKYYKSSAEKGYALAQFAVGECLEKGNGVKKDKNQAKEWYQKAADQGHLQAKEKLGMKVKKHKTFGITTSYGSSDNEFVASHLTAHPNDLTAASSGRKDASGNGVAVVKVQMPFNGVTFEGDMVGEPEFKTSEYWVYVPAGASELVIKYPEFEPLKVKYSGLGQGQLEPKTTYMLVVSYPADLVADDSQLTGEDCFRIGMGYAEKRDNQYVRWMEMGAKKGNLDAQSTLGNLYLTGTIVKKDKEKGMKMLTDASDAGHGAASYMIGRYYDLIAHKGKEAQKWYDKAAEQGFEAAKGKKSAKTIDYFRIF